MKLKSNIFNHVLEFSDNIFTLYVNDILMNTIELKPNQTTFGIGNRSDTTQNFNLNSIITAIDFIINCNLQEGSYRYSSYRLKHDFESNKDFISFSLNNDKTDYPAYLTHGDLIIAMQLCGFKLYKHIEPFVKFGINKRQLNNIQSRKIRYIPETFLAEY